MGVQHEKRDVMKQNAVRNTQRKTENENSKNFLCECSMPNAPIVCILHCIASFCVHGSGSKITNGKFGMKCSALPHVNVR